MKKKKLLFGALALMLTVGLTVGGATFALFRGNAVNDGNTVKAATLTLQSHRDDVPISGPMFYTTGSVTAGSKPTGLWAPLDSHTRAMFIKNTGTIDAKLTNVKAIPQGTAQEQADVALFADQAIVTIAAIRTPNGEALDATAAEALNQLAQLTYNLAWTNNGKANSQAAYNSIRQALLDLTYVTDANGNSVSLIVDDVYVGPLSGLLGNGTAAALPSMILAKGKWMNLVYTVALANDANNNNVQGKTIKLEFQSEFSQVANNPDIVPAP